MAAGYTTWTVLDNKPIDKLEANLWHVSGKMAGGNERKMVVARRSDGDLVIFNAIALKPADMEELEAFGRVAWMVVPNGFHRQDAFIWKQRFPNCKVVAPRGAAKAVQKAVAVDLLCDEMPADADVRVLHPAGFGDKEGMLVVGHGKGQTLVACDAILNVDPNIVKFPFTLMLAPMGTPSTPRFMRWVMVKDGSAWAAQLHELAKTTTRLIPGHGAIARDGGAALTTVAGRF